MIPALHWFRRDLRVEGNPSLTKLAHEHQGAVLGVFFFDRNFLSREDFSPARFAFFLDTLEALADALEAQGGALWFGEDGPEAGLRHALTKFKASMVGWNRDYEPFARSRDTHLERLLTTELGVRVQTERDHLILEPSEVLKADGTPYQVFTPFKRKWLETLTRTHSERLRPSATLPALPKRFRLPESVLTAARARRKILAAFRAENASKVKISLPTAGAPAARRALEAFVRSERLARYADARDIPAEAGTSQLSIFLKNGSITAGEILERAELASAIRKPKSSEFCFLNELIWREFYYSILHHFPAVEHEAFNPKYRALAWENRDDFFRAWKEGHTGYAIVDAGMRQLRETGWMHNRVRMIVASFLTKDLLVDYRWGERHFMRELLDGDLAPNNGGWQWAASTGCDPVPYFRIFNPELQGKRFDPTGAYVRRWCPELKRVPDRELHLPRQAIVDHAARKVKTLMLYKTSS